MQTYLKERIREVLTGSSHPIVIRIYGQDMEVLRAKAHEVEEKLLAIEGLANVHVELLVDIPQVEVEVDLERLAFSFQIPGPPCHRVLPIACVCLLDLARIHKTQPGYTFGSFHDGRFHVFLKF